MACAVSSVCQVPVGCSGVCDIGQVDLLGLQKRCLRWCLRYRNCALPVITLNNKASHKSEDLYPLQGAVCACDHDQNRHKLHGWMDIS